MERPILFSAPMVKAIMENKKTMTRRIVNPQPQCEGSEWEADTYNHGPEWAFWNGNKMSEPRTWRCKYGEKGQRLWVKETCNISANKDAVMYMDLGGKLAPDAPKNSESWCRQWKKCSSMFMPRWASRIDLEITGFRIERLQDITEDDAKREGVKPLLRKILNPMTEHYATMPYREAFATLWNEINGKKYHWSENCWVWVISFKRI